MPDAAPPEGDPAAVFLRHRPALIGLAYRMTGSRARAEELAQDAFLRWRRVDHAKVQQPRAWLLRSVARLALDQLKSAAQRHEAYVGPWLPEPVLEEEEAPQQAALSRQQDVSVALLLTLQRLTPAERAVFILHDLFDTPFAEIAALLRRTEPACRKLAERARQHLAAGDRTDPVSDSEARRIAEAFFAASRDGDEATLRDLLAADAVLHTDGGGIRPAALNLIHSADRIGRFFAGLARRWPGRPELLHLGRVNGLPGFVTREQDGLPQSVALEIRDGRIAAIYIMRNPRKLGVLSRQLGLAPPSG